MGTLHVRLPESLLERARALAHRDGISLDRLIVTALAEKIAARDGLNYLRDRGLRGRREAYLDALDEVPDVPPVPGDERLW